MKVMFPSKILILTAGLVLFGQVLSAQNNIRLFAPIYDRSSLQTTSFGAPYTMGSSTVSLTCSSNSEGTPTATLSSTADGASNLLVE